MSGVYTLTLNLVRLTYMHALLQVKNVFKMQNYLENSAMTSIVYLLVE